MSQHPEIVPEPPAEDDDAYPAHWIPGPRGVTAQLAAMPDDELLATINAALAARRR